MPFKPSLAAVALALLAGCGLVDRVHARQLAREGNAAYRASDFPGAARLYRDAIRLDPATPNVYLNLGYALFSLYDPDSPRAEARQAAADAMDAFDRHLASVPGDEKAKTFRVKTLLRAAPHDAAMADRAYRLFAGMLAANPADNEARQYLLTLFIDTRRYEQALHHFEPQLAAHPDDVETMKILAVLADKSGRTQDAVDWYRRRAEAADAARGPAFFYELGTYAWNVLQYQPDREKGEAGLRLADQGIEAERRAMALKADYAEAMAYANLLYLRRAALETTPQAKYEDEQRAYELRTEAARILGLRGDEAKAPEPPAEASGPGAGAPGPSATAPVPSAMPTVPSGDVSVPAAGASVPDGRPSVPARTTDLGARTTDREARTTDPGARTTDREARAADPGARTTDREARAAREPARTPFLSLERENAANRAAAARALEDLRRLEAQADAARERADRALREARELTDSLRRERTGDAGVQAAAPR